MRHNIGGKCPRGNFLRTFSVPASVDQKDIKADYRDGVLQVHLPKRPERKAQRVGDKSFIMTIGRTWQSAWGTLRFGP